MKMLLKRNKRRSIKPRTKLRMPTRLLRPRKRRLEAKKVKRMPRMLTTPPRLQPSARICSLSKHPSKVFSKE